MGQGVAWVDLLDPDEAEVRDGWPGELHPNAVRQLLAPMSTDPGDQPRPKLESHGDYLFGVFLAARAVPAEDRVYYQEVDLVLTDERVLVVRKRPPDGDPFDLTAVRDACKDTAMPAGMVAYHVIDEVAERYLDLIDDLNAEIDELEDGVEDLPSEEFRRRLSDLRHDLLHIRRTLAPTRDAVRRVVDNRLDSAAEDVFPHDVELHFGEVYDKLLRASEGLEVSRDLVGSVRDYHQAKVANDQNEVMKRLTVIASLLLLPTLIAGVYGQNLKGSPEQDWSFGYWWSWGLILLTTVGQLLYYRRRRWI